MSSTLNPFNPPKATDLTSRLVHELWVPPTGIEGRGPVLLSPKDQGSFVLAGPKGCGKTHILRWYSADVQQLRHSNSVYTAVRKEGYLGVYLLCRTIDAGRFRGAELSPEKWDAVFGYYLELSFAEVFLRLLSRYCVEGAIEERPIFEACVGLLTRYPQGKEPNLAGLLSVILDSRRDVDHYLNNVLFDSCTTMPTILLSPGAAWFDLPTAVNAVLFANSFVTLLVLDEIENLSISQQRVVQDRIRHRSGPVTLWVCGRPYGFFTWDTTTGEKNRENAEFRRVDLATLWGGEQEFGRSAAEICNKRLRVAGLDERTTVVALLESRPEWIEVERLILERERGAGPSAREKRLRKALIGRAKDWLDQLAAMIGTLGPLRQHATIAAICAGRVAISEDSLPEAVFQEASKVAAKLEEHFASDFRFQLVEDTRVLPPQWEYCGWQGILQVMYLNPRDLLSALRAAFDWWAYDAHESSGPKTADLSLTYQASSLLAVSDVFEETSIEADIEGHGTRAKRGVAALCQGLSACRRAVVPPEPSPSTFSVPPAGVSSDVQRAIEAAKLYGLLKEHSRKQKNLKAEGPTYQISAQLCPKFGLPVARRGAISLSHRDLDALFGARQNADSLREVVDRLAHRASKGKGGQPTQQISLFGVDDD